MIEIEIYEFSLKNKNKPIWVKTKELKYISNEALI